MPRIVFGLVGPIASGKGTVAKILADKGFSTYSLSDRIREEITKRGIEITRITLTSVANELRETEGAEILAKRTANLVEKDNPDLAVIDSIRNPAEANFIKQKFGAKIIGIVADQKRRYEFFKNRGSNSAGINTWEEFLEHDNKELTQAGAHKQQVNATLRLADFIIENNGTLEDLRKKTDEAVNITSG